MIGIILKCKLLFSTLNIIAQSYYLIILILIFYLMIKEMTINKINFF